MSSPTVAPVVPAAPEVRGAADRSTRAVPSSEHHIESSMITISGVISHLILPHVVVACRYCQWRVDCTPYLNPALTGKLVEHVV